MKRNMDEAELEKKLESIIDFQLSANAQYVSATGLQSLIDDYQQRYKNLTGHQYYYHGRNRKPTKSDNGSLYK